MKIVESSPDQEQPEKAKETHKTIFVIGFSKHHGMYVETDNGANTLGVRAPDEQPPGNSADDDDDDACDQIRRSRNA